MTGGASASEREGDERGLVRCHLVVVVLLALATGCVPHHYSYLPRGGPERQLTPVHAMVVSHGEASRHGLPVPLRIPFATGGDGTALVAQFLAQADARHATHVADLAIVIQTRRDGRVVECRSGIVPESVTASEWRPATNQTVSVRKPVTRMVSESVYRCKPVTSSQMRSRTEYEQQCGTVTRPVQRTRTAYSTSYSSLSKSSSSIPHTEYYTDYQSSYECKSVPVSRMRTEMVTETKCASEFETHMVTRYEFQLENKYMPAHFETFTRQRLRELAPVCYAIDDAVSASGEGSGSAGPSAPLAPEQAHGPADAPEPTAAADGSEPSGVSTPDGTSTQRGAEPVRAPERDVARPGDAPLQNRIEGMLFGGA